MKAIETGLGRRRFRRPAQDLQEETSSSSTRMDVLFGASTPLRLRDDDPLHFRNDPARPVPFLFRSPRPFKEGPPYRTRERRPPCHSLLQAFQATPPCCAPSPPTPPPPPSSPPPPLLPTPLRSLPPSPPSPPPSSPPPPSPHSSLPPPSPLPPPPSPPPSLHPSSPLPPPPLLPPLFLPPLLPTPLSPSFPSPIPSLSSPLPPPPLLLLLSSPPPSSHNPPFHHPPSPPLPHSLPSHLSSSYLNPVLPLPYPTTLNPPPLPLAPLPLSLLSSPLPPLSPPTPLPGWRYARNATHARQVTIAVTTKPTASVTGRLHRNENEPS